MRVLALFLFAMQSIAAELLRGSEPGEGAIVAQGSVPITFMNYKGIAVHVYISYADTDSFGESLVSMANNALLRKC
jgi:hypothetical protein